MMNKSLVISPLGTQILDVKSTEKGSMSNKVHQAVEA